MRVRLVAPLLALSAVLGAAGAAPAQAGLLDASLNNADVISHIGVLNTNINADVHTSEVKNANTTAEAHVNNDGRVRASVDLGPNRRVKSRYRRARER